MKLFTMTVVTLATASAFAASTTEYYNQPAAGAHNVDIGYEMSSNPGKTEANGGGGEADNKITRSDVTLQYRFGLNEDMAVGVKTSSGTLKTDTGTEQSQSGMTDLVIGLDGKSEAIHYGVDLGYNLGGKAKKDNRTSGGIGIGANVGYLATSDAWNFGGDLSYWHRLERTYDNSGTDVKLNGGNITKLAGFGEYNYGMGFAGAELSYNMIGDTTIKSTPESKSKGENFLGLKAYGSYDFNDMATGLVSIAMNMHAAHDVDDSATTRKTKASTETIVALGARLTF